jgi:hypothetical protein
VVIVSIGVLYWASWVIGEDCKAQPVVVSNFPKKHGVFISRRTHLGMSHVQVFHISGNLPYNSAIISMLIKSIVNIIHTENDMLLAILKKCHSLP